MQQLRSIEEFKILHERLSSDLDPRPQLVISNGTCGQASGSNDLIRIAKKVLIQQNLTGKIGLNVTGCHGFCETEPSILVEPQRTFYPRVDPADIPRIIESVVHGDVVEDLLYRDPVSRERIEKQDDIPFYKHQDRVLLSKSEKIDPIRIFNYIRNGGYTAFCKLYESTEPEAVVEAVKTSGLRGRGGAGFPTGLKWELLSKQSSKGGKVLICNADEGDPGAYMDRSLLEGNPHSIIEGMLIGALATGATEGIIY
ncbi:MAG: hydrogenase, partial [candidate division Zixibacteria bacterium]|nr:hydrogenase [candidate division Zixibacteria bacterium]